MTLEVQKYLQKHTLEDLNKYYGIEATHHEDGRVILNYSQINSPKENEIVRDCRGLVLNSKDWSLVSRSFRRFFNVAENIDQFNFDDCIYYSKEDGSLINVYWWQDKFHINTRGSFGDGLINNSDKSWKDVFIEACPNYNKLNPKYTYTFELCSPYNQVVRLYKEPKIYLLSAFDGEIEVHHNSDIFSEAELLGITKVSTHSFSNKEESILFLKSCKINDPTFEGFVLRDSFNNRVKIKSESYLNLHRLSNNGNVAHPKNLIPLIMDSEINEVLAYFPYLKTEINKWEKIIKSEWQNIDNLWYCYCDEISDKKFAKAIIGKTKFSDILFKSRKLNKEPKDFWNSEIIIKMLT
jgi:hypothetical protein